MAAGSGLFRMSPAASPTSPAAHAGGDDRPAKAVAAAIATVP